MFQSAKESQLTKGEQFCSYTYNYTLYSFAPVQKVALAYTKCCVHSDCQVAPVLQQYCDMHPQHIRTFQVCRNVARHIPPS